MVSDLLDYDHSTVLFRPHGGAFAVKAPWLCQWHRSWPPIWRNHVPNNTILNVHTNVSWICTLQYIQYMCIYVYVYIYILFVSNIYIYIKVNTYVYIYNYICNNTYILHYIDTIYVNLLEDSRPISIHIWYIWVPTSFFASRPENPKAHDGISEPGWWLVSNRSEKYDFVNWDDDDIPNIGMGK